MLCYALMSVVALRASKLRTIVEQKTIRVMRMKTELTSWLILRHTGVCHATVHDLYLKFTFHRASGKA